MPRFAQIGGRVLHYAYRPGTGRPVVFANSLGTDFRIWDDVVAGLPNSVPLLRLDKRGHGLSEGGDVSIATLADDMAGLMDLLGLSGAVVCGVSVGGMVAQVLAAVRPDLAARMVLSNTGLTIGDAAGWNARIAAIATGGMSTIADTIIARWFSPGFMAARPALVAGYRAMLARTEAEGYCAVCAAIRDCDLTAQAATIAQPTICLAGTEDASTTPEVVGALARALPFATLRLIDGCGHLPCIEAPGAVITAILDSLEAG
ncbi:MAG: 3-oxoadipate enol-lactonase [Limimaricola sp.]|uniref:3-oxoadipate enol-lactonase n=1 Tax=Limimaricola sp. TaxID=2211665 RepID=UPI001D9FB54F|nr:3-oxoadipate enol-lactonase [Limimaricola sp.]MBI1415695.1 3-oxoadipate enol-lactonase [Limimaricola sp.]